MPIYCVILDCGMRACMLEMVDVTNFYCHLIVWCMILTCMHAWRRWLCNILPISCFSGVDCCSSWLLVLLSIPSQRQICESSSDDKLWWIVCVRNFSHIYLFFLPPKYWYSVACFSLNLDILVVSTCCGTWCILDACLCVRLPVGVWKSERARIDIGLFCMKELFSYFIRRYYNLYVFRSLYEDYSQKQENKIWCIIHYFQRISSKMPKGIVSFERKALHLKNDYTHISCPDANFWSTSTVPLCRFEVIEGNLFETFKKWIYFSIYF